MPNNSPGVEILVGRNAVHEALRAGRRQVSRVVLAEGVEQKGPIQEILAHCRAVGITVVQGKRSDLDRLAGSLEHQGVAAQVSPYPYVDIDDMLALARERSEPPFLLVLDSLQDPQNVGSLLRTAEVVGVHGVIVPARRAVGITPAVSRASVGAVEHLSVALVSNLAYTFDRLKADGLWIVGVEDLPSSQDYRQARLDMPLALVLGSEGFGMRRLVAEKCDLTVRIPMRGQVGSLNVAVAGSLVLYEAWHARQPKDG
ncbi:MAG: 23S rRNA (guanosine(2251)-2'-O)-methyltransferase RlmB [Anaerolineae bacterium]